jgi:hypothetical protein
MLGKPQLSEFIYQQKGLLAFRLMWLMGLLTLKTQTLTKPSIDFTFFKINCFVFGT